MKLETFHEQLRNKSVILNYIEGCARARSKVHKNFLEIAYGSLQESKYLSKFSFEEKYLSKESYDSMLIISNEIGAMLWGMLIKINTQ